MAAKNDVTGDSIVSKTSQAYRDNFDNIQFGVNRMAEKNDKKDQDPRGKGLEDGSTIALVEKAERLRMAECAAKGGEYVNGSCHK